MKYGKRVCFHGAFLKKSDAKRKEREVGGFIREHKVRGQLHYFVMSEKNR